MMAFGGIEHFAGLGLGVAVLVFSGEWLRLFGTLRFVWSYSFSLRYLSGPARYSDYIYMANPVKEKFSAHHI